LPLLDIHTVGAGGGSIAYVDSGGSLRVGPQSAGAAPGPACYGQGNQATVTDANLLLGRIDPARFLGGRMRIDYDRARQALTRLAVKTSLDVMALAEGIVRIANANMERAVRVVSVERGFDPRDFTLVPFGGAGGLHACEVAASLDIRTILVPANPGVLSALGMLLSDTVWDFSQTLLIASKDVDLQHVTAELDRLAATAAARLAEDGFEADAIRLERTLDVRYVGQAYEINVPFAGAALVSDGGLAFVPAFHAAHERMYGYADPARAVEIVNVRVRATGVRDKPTLRHATGASERRHAPAVAECEVYADGRIGPARVFDRARLVPGDSFAGPAIAFDDGSTTFIAAGWSGVVDRSGNLVLAAATQGL
jgi:N-methylhydantoinase A/oxoprolinase/acetone carboxylase beta subunit